MLGENIDILIFSETKLDNSYPSSQFYISGYKKPFRLDVSYYSGGLLVYIKDDIIARPLNENIPNTLQIIPIELNFRKQKWLLIPVYRPDRTNRDTFLTTIEQLLYKY